MQHGCILYTSCTRQSKVLFVILLTFQFYSLHFITFIYICWHMDTFHDNVSLFWSLTLAWNDKEESILNMQLLQTVVSLLIFTWGKLCHASWCNLCYLSSCLVQTGLYPLPTMIDRHNWQWMLILNLNLACKSILFLPTNMIKMNTPRAILKIPRIFETVRRAQFLQYKIWGK